MTEAALAASLAGQRNGFTTQPVTPRPKPLFAPEIYAHVGTELVIEIEPMGAPRIIQSDKWKPRPMVIRYHALKDKIRGDCELLGYKLGAVVKLRFELSMPESWPEKKKTAFAGMPHQQKPDVDNLCKGFL